MKLCAVIPTHNHTKMLGAVVTRLCDAGLHVFIIDDGSNEVARLAIASFSKDADGVFVNRFEDNRGKGAAVKEGFRLAIAAGYTHALQIDADGQHDLNALQHFIAAAKLNPNAIISGQPIYDASIPKSRQIGRWLTHLWVWIETLSFRITDSMCGFRIYPLDPVQSLISEEPVGDHMEFDTEIIVRLFWRGIPPIMLALKVIYPPDNTSNFDLLKDNWRITCMHTRLFLSMLLRLPLILTHRPPQTDLTGRWAMLQERGAYWGLRFFVSAYKLLGRQGCRFVMSPIIFYFYVTSPLRRRASREFLSRALKRPSTFIDGYRHFMNFAMRALDVFSAWTGGLKPDLIKVTNPQIFDEITKDTRGGLIIVAHLGNASLAHALLDQKARERVTVLAHTHHAQNYNRILQEYRADAGMNILQVTELGPETVIDLKQRVEGGGRIVIAGDRTPVLHTDHISYVPFFGKEAAFPHGPWILGALLDCPVYLLFCLQDGKHYNLTMERFTEHLDLPRATREKSLHAYITQYASRLEHYAAADPLQWYNFFDFWAPL